MGFWLVSSWFIYYWCDNWLHCTGMEPLSYYLLNGLLNFNIVFLLAFLSPIAVEAQV